MESVVNMSWMDIAKVLVLGITPVVLGVFAGLYVVKKINGK